MIPDDKEEYEAFRRPEIALHALWLLRYYMLRQPGKPRWCLPTYAFCMARALLGLHAQAEQWTAPDYMDERLRHFGLEPETFQVVDKRKWAIAWKVLNKHWGHGSPWRIKRDEFDRLYDIEMKKGNGHIPNAAPITHAFLRTKYRPKKAAWNVKKPSKKDQSFYRPRNVFQSRVSRYLSELEDGTYS